mmetsp:Transcript_20635/g.53622  ORF Transcript_20635/g.53622 Transcript_20635/m.53622 type:complete len:181 (-) Transcript_20635:1229-1771(-)
MGGIFGRLWSLWGKEQHKLIIVGLDNAGKTTILYQFLMNEVVVTHPTIGSNLEEVTVNNLHFLMWDVSGQEGLSGRETWPLYYSGAKCLILVVDSSDRERVPIIREELHTMMAHEDLKDALLLVYANKQDAAEALSAAEISTMLGLAKLKGRSYHIQACCALTGEGLYPGMEWVTGQLKS